MNLLSTAFDRDEIVAALHARGVCYLVPTPTGGERPMNDEQLILALASSNDARLRFSLSALLVRNPPLAELAASLVETTTPKVSDEIKKQYLAALYLQRIWASKLKARFGKTARITERFWESMGLSSPDVNFGEIGLWELSQFSEFNDWATYEDVVELLCECPCVSEENIRQALKYV
jgi:hypothetical protein